MLEKLIEKSKPILHPATFDEENMLIGTWILIMRASPEMGNIAMDYLGKELYDCVLKEAKERGILE